MIAAYVTAILGIAYICTDLFLFYTFFKMRRMFSALNLSTIILIRFRDLMSFYSKSETSRFLSSVADSDAGRLVESTFSGSYEPLSREIELFYKQFRLPYQITRIPIDLRFGIIQVIFLSFLIALLIILSANSDILSVVLLFIILLNTVFFYPLFTLYSDARTSLKDASDSIKGTLKQ
ncbi:MAG: hypothetical protein M1422_07735 [Candidatus Thermoplasmatota archaeon]|jgi:hypothetical protein|nr:hypothetical protein [Candidatus Thermoplasmatota archaeon]MCL5253091.1 hypothetical protein [Candidatus Thermoplasmatota archaeon]